MISTLTVDFNSSTGKKCRIIFVMKDEIMKELAIDEVKRFGFLSKEKVING